MRRRALFNWVASPSLPPRAATSFLVIGAIGSRDWIHSTHGRKIEAAVKLREQGTRFGDRIGRTLGEVRRSGWPLERTRASARLTRACSGRRCAPPLNRRSLDGVRLIGRGHGDWPVPS